MGVHMHSSTTKAYYFAYPIGLFLSFFSYWAFSHFFPPALVMPLNEWHEPADYIRPEERGVVDGHALRTEDGAVDAEEQSGEKGEMQSTDPFKGHGAVEIKGF